MNEKMKEALQQLWKGGEMVENDNVTQKSQLWWKLDEPKERKRLKIDGQRKIGT